MYLKANSVYRSVGLQNGDKNVLKKMTLISSAKVVQIRKLIILFIFVIVVFVLLFQSNVGNKPTVLPQPEPLASVSDPTQVRVSKLQEDQEKQQREQGRLIMTSVNEPNVRVQELIDRREMDHEAEAIETSNSKQKQPPPDHIFNDAKSTISEKNDEVETPALALTDMPTTDTMKLKPETQENKPEQRTQKLKKILIWNDYWESKALWHKIFREIIYDKCPHSSCLLTSEKSQLTSSDAVLFHLLDLHKEKYRVPEYRDPKQIWIAMSFEPPYILTWAGVDFPRFNGVFNRTMTYRRDADIVIRHGNFFEITQETKFPNFMSTWVNSHDDTQERNYAQGKRRLVAWFASSRDCKSQSNRETYVHQLQQYIAVDIFGSCGPYKCGIQKTIRNPYKVEHDDCYMLLSVAYKFYLSFENSICEDYVTEKLYNHLKLNVIPVVFGGGNYSYFAPPHSIIDATKFTPKELADYLHLLDSNDELYNEYFNWKKNYYIEAHDGIPFICDLCHKINQPEWETERKVYDRFDSWYEDKCYPAYPGNETVPYTFTRNNQLSAT